MRWRSVRRSSVRRPHMRRPRMRRPSVRLLRMRSSVRLFSVRGAAHDGAAHDGAARHGIARTGAACGRTARWRRGGRTAPAVAVLLLGRTGRAVMTACRAARRARARRPVEAIRSRRHAPPVRQPAASAEPAGVRWCPVVQGSVRPVREAAVRCPAVRRSGVRPAIRPAGMRPGHGWPAGIRPGSVRRGGIRSGHVRPGGIRSGHVRPGIHWPAVRPRPVPPAIGVPAIRVAAVRVPAIRVPAIGVPVIRTSAVGVPAVRMPAVLMPAVRATARPWPLRNAVAGTPVRRHARREPAGLTRRTRLGRVGASWLTRPRRTGRCLARTARQLSVVVFVEVCRRPGPAASSSSAAAG